MWKKTLGALQQSIESGEPVALVTVVDVQGASPARVGGKLLVWPEGRIEGNIGGGVLARDVQEEAIKALGEGRSRLYRRVSREGGLDETGAPCGGEVTVFIEVVQPAATLLLVGGGHVGFALAEMGRMVGMNVQIIDERPERATVGQLNPEAITPETYVVIASTSHASDEEALGQVLDSPAAYIGMIGSRRKVQTIFAHLRAGGASEEQLARVRAPIGLDLGGRSPEEIAVAILAEIIQVRFGGTGKPRAPGTAPGG
jgi:xanthine dehydrogenase accessory factor